MEPLFAGKTRAEFVAALADTKKAQLRAMLKEQGLDLPLVMGGHTDLLGACFDLLVERGVTPAPKASDPPAAPPAPPAPAGGPRFMITSRHPKGHYRGGRYWSGTEWAEVAEADLAPEQWEAVRGDARLRVRPL